MKRLNSLILTAFLCAMVCNISAQEVKTDTADLKMNTPKFPLLSSGSMFHLSSPPTQLEMPKDLLPATPQIMTRNWDHLSYIRNTPESKKPILPFELAPNFNFNINPSRWDLPILGTTTTFSPTLTYQPYERMILYGGVGFTQYHNLSYVQNMIAPSWPTKSNITSQAFGGFAYILNDRITLHGVYQRSLYNQIPSNLMVFSPAFNTISVGADIDVWNGLGVSVDRVWEIDRSGRVYQGMRYSPYINMNKFVKFLGGN